MTVAEALAVLAAGIGAGAINAVVGSGTLITFPVLLAVGYSPIVANVSNTIGLVPGSVASTVGYRRELAGQEGRTARLAVASVSGGILGAIALLVLPASVFKAVVPVFIAAALVLVVAQPWLARRLAVHHGHPGARHRIVVLGAVFLTGVYGGYFGAAQGILLLGILGLALDEPLQRVNAVKNVLAGLVNLVAGIVFIFSADVAWGAAGLIAGGSMVGGVLGARYGRRLPPTALRALIVAVGLFAIGRLVL